MFCGASGRDRALACATSKDLIRTKSNLLPETRPKIGLTRTIDGERKVLLGVQLARMDGKDVRPLSKNDPSWAKFPALEQKGMNIWAKMDDNIGAVRDRVVRLLKKHDSNFDKTHTVELINNGKLRLDSELVLDLSTDQPILVMVKHKETLRDHRSHVDTPPSRPPVIDAKGPRGLLDAIRQGGQGGLKNVELRSLAPKPAATGRDALMGAIKGGAKLKDYTKRKLKAKKEDAKDDTIFAFLQRRVQGPTDSDDGSDWNEAEKELELAETPGSNEARGQSGASSTITATEGSLAYQYRRARDRVGLSRSSLGSSLYGSGSDAYVEPRSGSGIRGSGTPALPPKEGPLFQLHATTVAAPQNLTVPDKRHCSQGEYGKLAEARQHLDQLKANLAFAEAGAQAAERKEQEPAVEASPLPANSSVPLGLESPTILPEGKQPKRVPSETPLTNSPKTVHISSLKTDKINHALRLVPSTPKQAQRSPMVLVRLGLGHRTFRTTTADDAGTQHKPSQTRERRPTPYPGSSQAKLREPEKQPKNSWVPKFLTR